MRRVTVTIFCFGKTIIVTYSEGVFLALVIQRTKHMRRIVLLSVACPFLSILGAFATLRRGNISFVMSVCPSVRTFVRMEQLGSHWTDFHENSYLSISRKSVKKIYVSLKSDKNNGYSKWRPICMFDHVSVNSY